MDKLIIEKRKLIKLEKLVKENLEVQNRNMIKLKELIDAMDEYRSESTCGKFAERWKNNPTEIIGEFMVLYRILDKMRSDTSNLVSALIA